MLTPPTRGAGAGRDAAVWWVMILINLVLGLAK